VITPGTIGRCEMDWGIVVLVAAIVLAAWIWPEREQL
jgi:hypothetical protein